MRRVDFYNPQKPSPIDRFVFPIFKDYHELIASFAPLSGTRKAMPFRSKVVEDRDGKYAIILSTKIGITPEEQAKLDLYEDFFDIYRVMRASLINQLAIEDPFEHSTLRAEHMGLVHTLIAILKFLVIAMHQGVLTIEDIHELNGDIKGEDIDMMILKTLDPIDLKKHPALKGLRPFNPGLPVFEDHDSVLIGSFRRYVRKVYTAVPEETVFSEGDYSDSQVISVEEFLAMPLDASN
jgi:hypothetical protein